jgi:hypothetical protein
VGKSGLKCLSSHLCDDYDDERSEKNLNEQELEGELDGPGDELLSTRFQSMNVACESRATEEYGQDRAIDESFSSEVPG